MQSPKPQETVWLVSFADDDDRELTADEIGKALAAGEIVLTTIVWRDGMPDWKPIVEVAELRTVVQKQRVVRPRSTVMGGFGTPGAPPPAQLSPRPPPAASPPAPVGFSPPRGAGQKQALTPEPPFGRKAEGSPRGSLAGGLSAPRPSRKDEEEEGPATRRRVNTLSGPGEENRTTLTGPGGPIPDDDLDELELESDAEPISLVPESLDTLESDELESIVEEVPPEAPAPKIFDLEVTQSEPELPPAERVTPIPPRLAARAREQVLHVEEAASPSLPLVAATASQGPTVSQSPSVSRGPAAPAPPRKVHAPLPQTVDPLADLDDDAEPKRKKGGAAGKLLLAAVVLAGVGGAFYLGQKSAREAALNAPPVVTVQAPPIVTVVAATATPNLTAPSAEPSSAEEPDSEPESAEPSDDNDAPVARANTPPRAAAPRSDDRNVELSKEPSLGAAPAPPPKPTPAPKPDPEPDEPAATGPFDKDAAAAALARAASSAGSCRTSGDPSGVAQVSVTFSPTGRATRAIVDGPPFAGTATGGCIASKMTQARVPAFTGSRVTVRKKVVIQ